MSARARLWLSLAAIALPTAGLWYVLVLAPVDAVALDAGTIPDRLGDFERVLESQLDEDVLAKIRPASYLYRAYARDGQEAVWVYIALYDGRDETGAHDPDVCYPAQGWDIVERAATPIRITDETDLNATRLHAYMGRRQHDILYWFQPADRWPLRGVLEDVVRVVDSLRGRPQYAFVRLSTETREGTSREALRELARQLAPLVRSEIDGR